MIKNSFLKNIAILLTGTAAAQVIPILASPILTRFYKQEDFGLFATYAAIVSVLTILATAQYDIAIMMPKSKRIAFNLLVFIFVNSLIVSTLSVAILLGLSFVLTDFFFSEQSRLIWVLVLLGTLLSANYQAINYWCNRNQYYKRLALNRVGQTSITAISSIAHSQALKSLGLVVGQLAGQLFSFISIFIYVVKRDKDLLKIVSKKRILLAVKRYKQYPKVNIPISLINSTYNNSKFLLLSFVFSNLVIGQLYLVYRVIGLPASVIGNSLSEVLLQKIASNKVSEQNNSSYNLIIKSTMVMLVISIIPCVILFMFGEVLFEFVFGSNWTSAGKIAAVLSIGLAFEFTVSPLSKLMFVVNKNKEYLIWEIFRAVIIFIPLFVIKYFYDLAAIDYIWMITTSTAISYLVLLLIVLRVYKIAK